MKRRFKLLAVIISVPTVLAFVAVVVATALIDSNQYKHRIIALVKEHTGQELHIDGDLRLRLFPGLRLTASHIRLANPPGFSSSDLARLPWLMVEVKLLPLLAGRVEVGTVDVVGLRLNLERDQHGRGNWQTTVTAEHDANARQGSAAEALLAAMAVGELNVRDATLHWRDRISNETVTLTAVTLQTGAFRIGKGIDDVRLQATLLENGATIEARGDIRLAAAGGNLMVPKLATIFRRLTIAGMRVDGTLSTRLTADFAQQRLTLDSVRVSARAWASENRQIAVEISTALDFDFLRRRLTKSALSLKVPAYSLFGVDGDLVLKGVLSGDLRAATYTFEKMQGSGRMGGEALAGSDVAFALGGTLNADLKKRKIFAPELEIAGSVDGDRLAFRFIADLGLSHPARSLTATGMRLSLRDWQIDGTMTVRAAASPPGVQGVLDLRVQDRPLAGSFAVTESPLNSDAVDVRFDLVADLDMEGAGLALRGRSALVLRAEVKSAPADGSWQVGNLRLGVRLTDAAFPDGELTVRLRGDLEVDVNKEIVHSNNLRVTIDDSVITGSVSVRDFNKPAVRFDLHANTIDADRYLPSTPARSDGPGHATRLDASIDAIRALDFAGEVRVQKLTLNGVQMKNVRFTFGGG
ncbi:MAG: AsmA family protein [Gammaproteobacteria bacterium]|nr:MAG: AsmA family protein [Gammaproteobacteria bacterium]